jgi:hypothetical protein
MPTAVERSFLKLDGIDGRHEQAALTNAFLKIDSDFLKLSTAPNTDAFLKIEDSRQLKNSVDVIGDAFIKLGDDFGEIARGALKIDEFVIKWTAASSATGAASVDFNPQSDFLKLDSALTTSGADLKILGADFLKLDNSSSLKVFDHKLEGVGADFLKLEGDTAVDQAAFLKLGADFLKLGDVSDPSPLDLAYKELGGALQQIGADFGIISTDFGLLLPAVQKIYGGGVTVTSADLLSKVGSDSSLGAGLLALDQAFLKLDADLGAVGGPATRTLIGLLFTGAHGSGGGGGGAG